MSRDSVRYRDIAGYPDGMGFLDQGTAAREFMASAAFSAPSAESDDELSVVIDEARSEYRAMLGDQPIGVIRFASTGGETTLRSTYVDPALRGRGIATSFIAHVLDDRRAAGERLVVECPLIRNYIALHPEYRDVQAR